MARTSRREAGKPRRTAEKASRPSSCAAATVEPTPFDQLFFDQFRIGKWPDYFDNVQFDRKPETLDQFFRSVTPNTGPYDAGVISDAMAALFDKTGPASCSCIRRQAGRARSASTLSSTGWAAWTLPPTSIPRPTTTRRRNIPRSSWPTRMAA
jgi:hypothetical protein